MAGLADTANLAVKLTLDDRAFTGPLNRVNTRLGNLQRSLGKVGSGVGKVGAGIGRVFVTGAVAAGGALVAATKTALDFQDAMAGVSKTVEGTPDQIAEIGRQLLDLSTNIPVSATDLAAIAQELGALGVPRGEIAETARVVAELAAATVGLTPEAAAEAFGKLGNVLKIHGPDVERFGSSLVALGNAGASSEGDIITVATRFGAAGSQAKLSAAQVLGFASAIASLGVEPEAAGSSLSRLFNNVTKYIGTGDKKIKAFAKTAGVSVEQFSNLFAKDASGAMELFLKKLGGLDRFEASKVLKSAGITNVRDINAVLLLSQNYDELHRQLLLSTEAWKENTELSETAAKRFSSVQATLTKFWNTLKRSAIVMANEFLPALGRSIDRLTALLKLPSTDNDLKNLGQDIAGFLDGIHWDVVIGGARTFLGMLKDVLTVVSKVPPEIAAGVAAFATLNKLSGGLIGAGIGDIVGGIGGAVGRGLFSKIPVIGALAATPVFVTNWPLGGLGGIGGTAGAAAGGSILGTALKLIPPALVGIAVGEALKQFNAEHGIQPRNIREEMFRAQNPTPKPIQIDTRNLSEGNRAIVDKVANARNSIESTRIALDARLGAVRGAVTSSTAQIVGAIRANQPVINLGVFVDKGDVGIRTGGTGAVIRKAQGNSGVPGAGHGM